MLVSSSKNACVHSLGLLGLGIVLMVIGCNDSRNGTQVQVSEQRKAEIEDMRKMYHDPQASGKSEIRPKQSKGKKLRTR